MRGNMHHIDLTVRDPAASFGLYDAFFTYLGYEKIREFEWQSTWKGGEESVSLVKASTTRPHDRYSPGLHHIAWRAENQQDVDRLYALLLEWGAKILDAPAHYPQYNSGRGYYAVFFADADGLKLEFAWTPR